MKKIIYGILTSMLCMIPACMQVEIGGEAPFSLPEGTYGIQFSLKTVNQPDGTLTKYATRATEAGDKDKEAYSDKILNENKIDNLTVFFFDTSDNSLVWRVAPENIQKKGDTANAEVLLVAPTDMKNKISGENLTVVIVANQVESIPTIHDYDELKAYVYEPKLSNSGKPQIKFLMDGSISTGTIEWNTTGNNIYNIPETLYLQRAASKFRLLIKNFDTIKINGIQYDIVGAPMVKLGHYASKTRLLNGNPYPNESIDWQTDDYREMEPHNFSSLGINENYYSASLPFYAYENNWTDNPENETYLQVKIDLKSGDGNPKSYYYRYPINCRLPLPEMTEEEKAGLYKNQRNHLYHIVSSISILGNEDESEPFEVESNITIQPWNELDAIDGSIKNAHYLLVHELKPIMLTDVRDIGYLSDLPVTIKIEKTRYELYNEFGEIEIYEKTNGFPADMVTSVDNGAQKILRVKNPIPINYVPLEIIFTVTQKMPESELGTPLSVQVKVTQYPAKYVTGKKSDAFRGGTSKDAKGNTIDADFRFHDGLGVIANYQDSSSGPQKNDVLYKITTLTNVPGEYIGNPVDNNGYTKTDLESNKLISPEFMIASQHGLYLPNTTQYTDGSSNIGYHSYNFDKGYGPFSSSFPDFPIYRDYDESKYDNEVSSQALYIAEKNAKDRCYNYFEDEYGTDGVYKEFYLAPTKDWDSRLVYKTFKYNGRWRIPTMAELKTIDRIQDDSNSAIKYLLYGKAYWSATTSFAYSFSNNSEVASTVSSIRCVFDTYKLENNE